MRHRIILLTILFLFIFSSCKKTDESSDLQTNKHDTVQVISEPENDTISNKDISRTDTAVSIIKPGKDTISYAKEEKKVEPLTDAKEKEFNIKAYYFHPTARCSTCLNIESYSLEAIKEWERMNDKNISWSEINIEDSTNEHYIKEYDLQFSSLIIVKYNGNEKLSWKNLEETWKLVNDKSSFTKYINKELDNFIKEN
jgi:hypothetical protein